MPSQDAERKERCTQERVGQEKVSWQECPGGKIGLPSFEQNPVWLWSTVSGQIWKLRSREDNWVAEATHWWVPVACCSVCWSHYTVKSGWWCQPPPVGLLISCSSPSANALRLSPVHSKSAVWKPSETYTEYGPFLGDACVLKQVLTPRNLRSWGFRSKP